MCCHSYFSEKTEVFFLNLIPILVYVATIGEKRHFPPCEVVFHYHHSSPLLQLFHSPLHYLN